MIVIRQFSVGTLNDDSTVLHNDNSITKMKIVDGVGY